MRNFTKILILIIFSNILLLSKQSISMEYCTDMSVLEAETLIEAANKAGGFNFYRDENIFCHYENGIAFIKINNPKPSGAEITFMDDGSVMHILIVNKSALCIDSFIGSYETSAFSNKEKNNCLIQSWKYE
jgi:hypothetical protein